MAYTKTNWVDNTTPIDKDNLNKIEQGIYDNSLVVDAVTEKLNPTSSDVTITASLTEGQILDVIGVADIIIKGDTEQDGTPTPSSPVDVNVVSGSNIINTSNKNLLKLTNYSIQTINGINLTFKNGAIICNGTATANVIVNLLESNLTLQQGAYALSGCPSGGGVSSNYKLDIFKINENAQLAYDIGNGTTFTLSEQTTFDRVRLVIFNGKTVNNLVFKPQLEKGSTATTYEAHQGKELSLDLPVENLFDKDDTSKILNAYIDATGRKITASNGTKSLYVPIKPNTEYVISKILSARFLVGTFENYEIGATSSQSIIAYNSSTSGTITSGANDRYLGVFYYLSSADTLTEKEIRNSIQVEEGSKANAYTPYGTDPIELYKIGNYQDYFYKSGNDWYLHKEMGKAILNGTENWSVSSGTGFYRFVFTNNIFKNDASLATKNILISNMFKATNFNARNTDYNETCYQISNGATVGAGMGINTNIASTVNDFKTWLASNNVTVYYVLVTPTDTEITDTDIISQLEAIYNAPLYEQTNITQTNNDLPMVLDITAFKDNINGIKAFIRK